MRIVFVVLFSVLVAVPVCAQTSATIGTMSTYVVDNGDEPYDRPIMWMSVSQKLRHGFSAGFWGSAGEVGGRELDLLAGWKGKKHSVDVGYFLHAGGSTANVVQVDLRSFRKIGDDLEVFVMVSPVLPTNTSGDAGILARAGFNHSLKFGKITLEPAGWVLYDTGIFKGEKGFSLRGELGFPVKRGRITLSPVVRLSVPINMEKRDARGIAGIRFIM